MRICVCDDDYQYYDIIRSLIDSFFENKTNYSISYSYSGEDLIKRYEKHETFDIVFLDIEMYEINGIKVAELIRKSFPNTIIIFVSNHMNYVFEAFRLEALHFIVKPIKRTEFNDVFYRAINKYNAINSSITLRWQNERYIISVDDITYIEGYKRHITVHTKEEEFEAIGKIPDILNLLSTHNFIRIHQGFIVNMDYIKCFDSNDVILKDNTKVMVSVRKRTEALKSFDLYIKKRKW